MTATSTGKVVSISEAVATIPDGAKIALGGNTIHRSPSAAVHELVRQGKRDITVIKTAGGYDVDLLAGTGVASTLIVAYVGFENLQGLAPRFRRSVESGEVTLEEQTCTSVITGLRASAQGIPFMPIAGMSGSDLVPGRFLSVSNPYDGGEVVTVQAITPDWAIIHVQEADPLGNARIRGTQFEDVLMSKAAKHVLITCERIVDGSSFESQPGLTAISAFQVDLVVEAPGGALPASCAGLYDVDEAYLTAYFEAAASPDQQRFEQFVEEHVLKAGRPEIAVGAVARS